jgi:hypothetical protein
LGFFSEIVERPAGVNRLTGPVSFEIFFKMLPKSTVYFLSDPQAGTPKHLIFSLFPFPVLPTREKEFCLPNRNYQDDFLPLLLVIPDSTLIYSLTENK